MTARELLLNIIQGLPGRGVDNVNLYLHSLDDNKSYEVIEISNNGSNDGIFMEIKKI